MEFVLIGPDNEDFTLPVNPIDDVEIDRGRNYETINIIDLGEVDFRNGEKIKEIRFSSFFPIEYDSSYCKYPDIPDPQEAMNKLTTWMNEDKPVRFIITGTAVNVLVNISVHTSKFRGGEPGDVYYDLVLRTHRDIKVRKVGEARTGSRSNKGGRSRPDTKPVPKVYVVRPGDSLWKIAKLELDDGSKWKKIYNIPENKKVIGPDPNLIKPGQKLVMPV